MIKITFVFSMVMVSLAKQKRNAAWFMTLPNERLEGVPSMILQMEKHYPVVKNFILSSVGRTGHSQKIRNEAKKQQRIQPQINEFVPFPCNLTFGRSRKKPTSVHTVRPGDIDVVAAMGDSLTAGTGAYALNALHLAIENRGVCSFIGGQGTWREHLTIPNMLKEYNPKLVGYSLGDSYTHNRESQFNVAEVAAMGQDMPYMARQLVKRIKNDPRVDFNDDWKLVTLLIGSNNFCLDICYLRNSTAAVENYRKDIIKSLMYLQKNMPRTIVNWIQSPNLKFLIDFVGVPAKCQLTLLFECPCLFSLQFRCRRNEFISTMTAWQKLEEEVANDERFRSKDDFTIILQPCLQNLTSPMVLDQASGQMKTDVSYMSFDCFHLSQKGYARLSNSIWNNILEPVGSKTTDTKIEFRKFECPTEKFPYIYTWKNSKNRTHIRS